MASKISAFTTCLRSLHLLYSLLKWSLVDKIAPFSSFLTKFLLIHQFCNSIDFESCDLIFGPYCHNGSTKSSNQLGAGSI